MTQDDIEICTLAVSWQVLLLVERPTLVQILTQPNEIFVRLAEIYLLGLLILFNLLNKKQLMLLFLGPELFENDILNKSVKVLLDDYIFEKSFKNLLTLRISASIASLDAFWPLYLFLLFLKLLYLFVTFKKKIITKVSFYFY